MTPEQLLAFEAAYPHRSSTKDELIRSELGITPVRYIVLLHRAARSLEGAAAHPFTARRVRERAATRERIRLARTAT